MQVTTGEERRTVRKIWERVDGLTILIPERELYEKHRGLWTLSTRVMLPGYLFLCLPEHADENAVWHGVRRTEGVQRILGRMTDADARRLRVLANGGNVWGISRCKWQGGRLNIYSGPLSGHEDWIVDIDRHRRRARVEIQLGMDVHRIDLGLIQDEQRQDR